MISQQSKNEILNILSQIETTSIHLGHYSGHGITSSQLLRLKQLTSQLEVSEAQGGPSKSAPLGGVLAASDRVDEHILRAERQAISRDIKTQERVSLLASKPEREKINLELGKLLSRRAEIDRRLRAYE
jgi:hypothetical protein